MEHDPGREILELRNQLSYSKRMGFLLGAGTSKAVGIPDISGLTDAVHACLQKERLDDFNKANSCLNGYDPGKKCTVEDILNHIRLVRQVTHEDESKNFDGINGKAAKELDIQICDNVYKVILEAERNIDPTSAQKFASWLNWLNRDYPKEIFTTNYDLVIERALESLQIPYFDGFVGADEPFFLAESLEASNKYDFPPISWIRLWKLHGSLGWFWKPARDKGLDRVVRLGVGAKQFTSNELVIYPSREKYESSRKQPFFAYFDRLRSFLQEGEGLFIITGYSFSDDHINEVIFNGLRQNNRLHVIGFFFDDEDLKRLSPAISGFMNFSAFGPKTGIIKGFAGNWKKQKGSSLFNAFWDTSSEKLTIGDFKELVTFLVVSSGKQEKIEEEIKRAGD